MIYYTMVFIICFLFLLLYKYPQKYFLMSSFGVIFIFEAFRKYELWGDLVGYSRRHESLADIDSLNSFIKYIDGKKDPGYYFCEWISTKLGMSFGIWMAIIAFFFLFTIGFFIYKRSEHSLISILLFIALGFLVFSLSGLRQTTAIAIVLWSYMALEKNRKLLFVLLVLLASLFHKSALIVLILILFRKTRFGIPHIVLSIIGIMGFIAYSPQIRIFLNENVFVDNYSGYQSSDATLNFTGFIIQAAIFLFCIFYYKKITNENKRDLLLYNSLFLGLIFQLFASLVAEMFRISMYFSVYSLVLVPKALYNEKDKEQLRYLSFLIIFVLLFYIVISGGVEYQFYWN